MSAIALFGAFEGQDIRWNSDLDNPWWVGRDICAVLEIANPWDALGGLEDDERDDLGIPDAIGRMQKTIIINEVGLYRLVFKSRTERAKLFQKWVFQEVLPTIRKTGSFCAQPQKPLLPSQRLKELMIELKSLGCKPDKALQEAARVVRLDGQLELTQLKLELKLATSRRKAPSVEESTVDADSIRDFLEKLFILEAQSKVGEWNLRWIEKGDRQRVLALHLPSIWAALNKEFAIAYSRKALESLLEAEGSGKTRQRFHRSEDESKAYRRALLTCGKLNAPNMPQETIRWCYELTEGFVRENGEKNRSSRSTSGLEVPQTLAAHAEEPLISADHQDVNRGKGLTSKKINKKIQQPRIKTR